MVGARTLSHFALGIISLDPNQSFVLEFDDHADCILHFAGAFVGPFSNSMASSFLLALTLRARLFLTRRQG
jgi:hypothetical protein